MFGRIDSYKMLNQPKIDFNSRQLTYSNYLNFQSDIEIKLTCNHEFFFQINVIQSFYN